MQDIVVGVVTAKCPSHQLLNYMLLIGKVYLWVCRANKTPPKIHDFKKMTVAKYETERLITYTTYIALTVKQLASLRENCLYLLRICLK